MILKLKKYIECVVDEALLLILDTKIDSHINRVKKPINFQVRKKKIIMETKVVTNQETKNILTGKTTKKTGKED